MTAARRHLPIATTLAALTLLGVASAPAALASSALPATTGHHGQDVCPEGDGWKKFDNLTGTSYEAKADAGYVIDAYCVKSATTVAYKSVSPGAPEVTVTTPSTNRRGVSQDISHVTVHEVKAGQSGWDWRYPAPDADGVTVTYPTDLPSGQANDANVAITNLDTGEQRTFNFHNDKGTWSGTHHFNPTTLPGWPGWKHYAYTWVQVAGTNYHWQGHVECGGKPTSHATSSPSTSPSTKPSEDTTTTPTPSSDESSAATSSPSASSTPSSTAPSPSPSTSAAPSASTATTEAPASGVADTTTASPEATTVVLAAGGTASPTTSAAAVADSSGDLAETGANVLPYVIGAVLLVAAGGTLVVVRRRAA
ncbi:hypothetical protein [Luteimicrobium sp. DT211]|uniref:hypothetical protein n=1 Tax=Luteimicrobium sp. DT211 TaxID=3393412 RepID=UPI003CF01B11